MLVTVKLKLRSPFLGELRPDNRGVRRIRMERGLVKVNLAFWQEQFREAAGHLQYDVDVTALVPPEGFPAASLQLYKRVWSKVNMEWFESFRSGTVLTMDFLVKNDKQKAPNPAQMSAILKFTGDRLGLSQFGNKFGYGRFDLISLAPATNEKYERTIERGGNAQASESAGGGAADV